MDIFQTRTDGSSLLENEDDINASPSSFEPKTEKPLPVSKPAAEKVPLFGASQLAMEKSLFGPKSSMPTKKPLFKPT
ncbi:hypothetical protein PABG_02469 [Paracoccidioides brasiliensis Pb03]|nr:hypothetical protein PABG_02469 [Paracoccidioides brasiliensis Pb03]